MPILHLCLDEKFINFARKVYEAAYPDQNEWHVYRPKDGPLKHVHPSGDVRPVSPDWLASSVAKQAVNAADVVVIHYLDQAFVPLLQATSPKFAVWHSWGEDLYPLLRARMPSLYLPTTTRLMRRLRARQALNPGQLAGKLKKRFAAARNGDSGIRAALQKLDVASMTPGEFDTFQRCWPGLKTRFQYFHYYSVEDSFLPGPDRMTGRDILLGNSASGSNNHMEALEMLGELDLTDRRVFCPLSYGDASYARAVTSYGKKKLGDNFYPMTNFLALADYYAMIESCGFVFLNHVRQQAVGTIGAALYKGASVFLRPENPALTYFRETGATLFEVEEFDLSKVLGEEVVTHNRNCLIDRYTFDRVVNCVAGYPVVDS